MKVPIKKRTAVQFVILFGFVSLFADMTYEGARSITGQYLAILGASGAVVGIVSGFGELVGYGMRLLSGRISDKTGRYWLITCIGYAINLLAVPLLALAGNWPLAAALIILERFGKAIRSPSKDAMLSYATYATGRGWGFGLHEAMDQIGAIIGPLLVSTVLYYHGSYQMSFGMLLIPALCALSVLAAAKLLYPRPQDLEVENPAIKTKGLTKTFWLYIAAISCVAAGYVDFPLIAFHFKKLTTIKDAWVPIFFAVAMAAAGLSALIFGRLFDKKGLSVLIFATAVSSLFAPLVFIDGFYVALIGMVLWGIGLGAQESIMRAVVANIVSMDKRGTAYGIMNIWFGISWFLGSALMGFLYDISVVSLVIFSLGIQVVALPILFAVKAAK
ncbi:MAG: MFS transporter [Verrucomicrobia bacterium]|nr:MFS transporter [Verrucomicrobiota bacterium]